MNSDFNDFYIGYKGHPRYSSTDLIEDDIVRVVTQKYEMIIFTNKGDIMGEPNFGANLVYLLHESKLSSESIKNEIDAQIEMYIPELTNIPYELKVDIYDDPESHQEYMVIRFKISEYEVYASVS